LMIYGESTTIAVIDYEKIASDILRDIGYRDDFRFIKTISAQSPEIYKAVVGKTELTANDQGIVYGYACDETRELMPLPIMMAHKLMSRYEKWRRERVETDFFADAKSQVSIAYENDKPVAVHTILISVSHSQDILHAEIKSLIQENIINAVLSDPSFENLDTSSTKIIMNPSGAFTIWGSHGDSGCVGRKIIVDTYGGVGRHGGGCFSSKNATKIDRSGAYYCRYVAKSIVASGLASKCEVSASYAIGLVEPLNINIDTFSTNKVDISEIYKKVRENFDFTPANIIKELDLLKPQYKQTACYGHFGRDEFAWEKSKKL